LQETQVRLKNILKLFLGHVDVGFSSDCLVRFVSII
jgi:hypothetical protein